MKTLNILLEDTKAYSINTYYYGTRRVRTREARAWGESIHKKLKKYETVFQEFRDKFDPDKHAIECTIIFTAMNLYNNSGSINVQAKDLSNVEKCLLDIVTGTKYLERGEATLGIDDKYIVVLNSSKVYGDTYNIDITFKIVGNKYESTLPHPLT